MTEESKPVERFERAEGDLTPDERRTFRAASKRLAKAGLRSFTVRACKPRKGE